MAEVNRRQRSNLLVLKIQTCDGGVLGHSVAKGFQALIADPVLVRSYPSKVNSCRLGTLVA